LVMGFGDAEHPDCKGITPELLQEIDFSKIDFHDFYGDLNDQTQKPDLTHIKQLVQKRVEQYHQTGQLHD